MWKRDDRHTGGMQKSILKGADIAPPTCSAQSQPQTCSPNYSQDDFERTCTSSSIVHLSRCTRLMQEWGRQSSYQTPFDAFSLDSKVGVWVHPSSPHSFWTHRPLSSQFNWSKCKKELSSLQLHDGFLLAVSVKRGCNIKFKKFFLTLQDSHENGGEIWMP